MVKTTWKATHIGEGEFRKEIIIDVATCGQIAEVLDTGNGRATAEFIATACNSHDDLLAELETCRDILIQACRAVVNTSPNLSVLLHRHAAFAQEAIQKAKANPKP